MADYLQCLTQDEADKVGMDNTNDYQQEGMGFDSRSVSMYIPVPDRCAKR